MRCSHFSFRSRHQHLWSSPFHAHKRSQFDDDYDEEASGAARGLSKDGTKTCFLFVMTKNNEDLSQSKITTRTKSSLPSSGESIGNDNALVEVDNDEDLAVSSPTKNVEHLNELGWYQIRIGNYSWRPNSKATPTYESPFLAHGWVLLKIAYHSYRSKLSRLQLYLSLSGSKKYHDSCLFRSKNLAQDTCALV